MSPDEKKHFTILGGLAVLIIVIIIVIFTCQPPSNIATPATFTYQPHYSVTTPLALGPGPQAKLENASVASQMEQYKGNVLGLAFAGDPILNHRNVTDEISTLATINVPFSHATPKQFISAMPTSSDRASLTAPALGVWSNPYMGAHIFPRPPRAVAAIY